MNRWDRDFNTIEPEDEKTLPVIPIILGTLVITAAIFAGIVYYQMKGTGNKTVQNVMETAESIGEADQETEAMDVSDAFEYAATQENDNKIKNIEILPNETYATAKEAADNLISGSNLVSSDLDFWHMYDRRAVEKKKDEPEIAIEDVTEEDPSTDGKHTKIVTADGTEEWIEINPYLKKNTINNENFVFQYPEMKYYDDGSKISKVGVVIDSDYGEVDFEKVRNDGIDFVMLRIGYRGYTSGDLVNDEKFFEYYTAAKEAGLLIGGYFYSQAISEHEALEEAARVVEVLQGFEMDYPIGFVMEYVKNDTARVTGLSRLEKSKIAAKFMDAMKSNGLKSVYYGNKEWLIKTLDLQVLMEYDTWYSEVGDVPDYPYQFAMWEYTKDADIDGLSEPARLSVCLVDYRAK